MGESAKDNTWMLCSFRQMYWGQELSEDFEFHPAQAMECVLGFHPCTSRWYCQNCWAESYYGYARRFLLGEIAMNNAWMSCNSRQFFWCQKFAQDELQRCLSIMVLRNDMFHVDHAVRSHGANWWVNPHADIHQDIAPPAAHKCQEVEQWYSWNDCDYESLIERKGKWRYMQSIESSHVIGSQIKLMLEPGRYKLWMRICFESTRTSIGYFEMYGYKYCT